MKSFSVMVGACVGLFGLVTLASCTVTDDGPSGEKDKPAVASTRSAVIEDAILEPALAVRMAKKCGIALPPGVTQVIYGPSGPPSEHLRPHPVIAAPKPHAFQSIAGKIALSSDRKNAAKIAVADVANGASSLTSGDGKMEVGITLRRATAVRAVASGGLLVYPGGHPDADVVQRETGDGAEDWLLFPRAPSAPTVEYELALSRGVASVRHVGNTVELLDAGGAPRLRMAPPYIVGNDCRVTEATVAVTGCAADHSVRLPYGGQHPVPGASACTIALSWPSSGVTYPAMLDPSWSSAASMATARAYHTATKPSGSERVLVIGGLGTGSYNVLSSAEVYDTLTDTWAAYGTMATARYAHAAMLVPIDGSIMVAGGFDSTGNATATVEGHDGMGFSARASMPAAAAGLTLDPIAVDWGIAAGGYRLVSGSFRTVADAPIYSKSANQWYARTLPGGTRAWHSSVVTPSGVVFVGGERNNGAYSVLSSVERYNPTLDTFSTLSAMPVARTKLTAAALPGASIILAAGGETSAGAYLKRTDALALSGSGAWTQGSDLAVAAARAGGAPTADGGLAVTGGYSGTAPTAGTVAFASAATANYLWPLDVARYAHTTTGFSAGRILAVGGIDSSGQPTASAEFVGRSMCNVGGGQAPVVPSWGILTTGSVLPGASMTTKVANTTAEALDVTLSVRARGLDGRDVTRAIWSGTVAAGHETGVAITPSILPVQSVGSKAVAELKATITAAATSSHLVGVTAFSQQLAYTFAPGYASATLHGDEVREASFLEGIVTEADLEERLTLLSDDLEGKAGKVWNGSSFDDVTTLADLHDSSGFLTWARDYKFSADDVARFLGTVSPLLTGHDPNGHRVCAHIKADYIDDGKGESVAFSGSAPASYMYLNLFDVKAQKIRFSGYADADGCTPQMSSIIYGQRYMLGIRSAHQGPTAATVENLGQDYSSSVGFAAFKVSGSPPPGSTMHVNYVADKPMRVAAAIGRVLASPSVDVPPQAFRTIARICSNNVYSACASSDGKDLYLGPISDADKTHNTQWKFVIAHEFGHLIANSYFGYAGSTQTPYLAVVPEALCTCDHVLESDERTHCMQSKEFYADVENEAFAHMVAANTWNVASPTACSFVYYKAVKRSSTSAVEGQPVNVSCADKVKWLENQCLQANRGVEWDWMNWMRALTMEGPSRACSVSEVGGIFKKACGSVLTGCQGRDPVPADLINAADVIYGFGSTKAQAVRDALNDFGADH